MLSNLKLKIEAYGGTEGNSTFQKDPNLESHCIIFLVFLLLFLAPHPNKPSALNMIDCNTKLSWVIKTTEGTFWFVHISYQPNLV